MKLYRMLASPLYDFVQYIAAVERSPRMREIRVRSLVTTATGDLLLNTLQHMWVSRVVVDKDLNGWPVSQ